MTVQPIQMLYTVDQATGKQQPKPWHLTFNAQGKVMVSISNRGEVTMGEGVQPEEAAQAFWGQVQVLGATLTERIRILEQVIQMLGNSPHRDAMRMTTEVLKEIDPKYKGKIKYNHVSAVLEAAERVAMRGTQ